MKIALFSLVSTIILSAGSAFANNWYDRGNGGFVLSCPNAPLKVLDVYETEVRYFFTLKNPPQNDAIEIAEAYIARLDKLDLDRANLYRNWLQSFYNEAQLLGEDIEFTQTPDLGLVRKPKECSLIQVVFQREPSKLNPPRYIINKPVWDSLDAHNRAALILHELIYRDFLSGVALESTSERIRLFNALLLGNKLEGLSLEEYIGILQDDLHMSYFSYNGIRLFLGATDSVGKWKTSYISYYSPNRIMTGRFAANQISQYPGIYYFCMSSDENPDGGSITFYESGKIRHLNLNSFSNSKSLCSPPSTEVFFDRGSQVFSGNNWEFSENGQPKIIRGTTADSIHQLVEYKGMGFERKVNLGLLPSVETYFRFDEKLNLVEIGLGGRPCIIRDLSVIRFEHTSASRQVTVKVEKDGQVLEQLDICSY